MCAILAIWARFWEVGDAACPRADDDGDGDGDEDGGALPCDILTTGNAKICRANRLKNLHRREGCLGDIHDQYMNCCVTIVES